MWVGEGSRDRASASESSRQMLLLKEKILWLFWVKSVKEVNVRTPKQEQTPNKHIKPPG